MFKYQHIENDFNSNTVKGLLNNNIVIQPKLDGMNCQIYLDNNELIITSRNNILSEKSDANYCYKTLYKEKCYIEFFKKYPNIKLIGEFLTQHTILYNKDAYNKLYIFDGVYINSQNEFGHCDYINYEKLVTLLKEFNINYVPFVKINYYENLLINFFNNPDYLQLTNYLIDVEANLLKLPVSKKHIQCFGEGVVIKNYDYKNSFNRSIWCKLINMEFYKNKNFKPIKQKIILNINKLQEELFIQNNLTYHLLDKCYYKLIENNLINLSDFIKLCQKEFKEDFIKEHSQLNIKLINNIIAIKAKDYLQLKNR